MMLMSQPSIWDVVGCIALFEASTHSGLWGIRMELSGKSLK